MPNTSSKQQQFQDLLKDFDTAMLVTQSSAQQLRCRPMAVAKVADDSDIWFVTSLDAAKVSEVLSNPQVCVSMQKGRAYLSLSGKAEVVHDRAKIKELWSEAWKVWFPDGQTDASIALIHVDAQEGEYWDTSGLKGLKYLFKAGKAYLAGTKLETDDRMNQKLDL